RGPSSFNGAADRDRRRDGPAGPCVVASIPASTEPPTVIGGERSARRVPRRCQRARFNGAADRDRRRVAPVGIAALRARAASTEPPTVIGGEKLPCPHTCSRSE